MGLKAWKGALPRLEKEYKFSGWHQFSGGVRFTAFTLYYSPTLGLTISVPPPGFKDARSQDFELCCYFSILGCCYSSVRVLCLYFEIW